MKKALSLECFVDELEEIWLSVSFLGIIASISIKLSLLFLVKLLLRESRHKNRMNFHPL